MVVIDVGAHYGNESTRYANLFSNTVVYAFEPHNENFEKLVENTKIYKNIIPVKKAVGLTDGMVNFNVSNYDACSSVLEFDENGIKNWKYPYFYNGYFETIDRYDVEMVRLDTFIKENNIKTVDFLKIDAQGYDFNVLKSLGDLLHCVKQVKMEVQIVDFELYKNQSVKSEVEQFMNDNNFQLTHFDYGTIQQEQDLYYVNKNYKPIE